MVNIEKGESSQDTILILICDGVQAQGSAKTLSPIPRELAIAARELSEPIASNAPVAIGQVTMEDVAGASVQVAVMWPVESRLGSERSDDSPLRREETV